MARTLRTFANSNIYHIVLKGNNAEVLFFDDADYTLFLREIKKACDEYKAEILAYCAMNNHVHLMIKFCDTNISNVFKSFGASFAYRYNRRHNRTGRIFNSRYYSKAIESEEYLFAVLRYIHFNPIKAGICSDLLEYQWSSYNDYDFGAGIGGANMITSVDYINQILNKEQFDELHSRNKTADSVVWDYIIGCSVCKPSAEATNNFIRYIMQNYEEEQGIDILIRSKVPTKTICEEYNISRRRWELYRAL